MTYTQAANKAIELAGKHIKPSNRTSAGLCLQDAIDGLRMLTKDNKKFYDAMMQASKG